MTENTELQTKVLSLINGNEEVAKGLLLKMSGNEQVKIPRNIEIEFSSLLSKPLWVDSVKKIHGQIFNGPRIGLTNNMELSDYMPQQKTLDTLIDEKDQNNDEDEQVEQLMHPYYITIKKIMYAYGDTKNPYKESILEFGIFIKAIIDCLLDTKNLEKLHKENKSQISNKLKTLNIERRSISNLKKVLSKVFPQEYQKFYSFNKLKHITQISIAINNGHNSQNHLDEFNLSDTHSDDDIEKKIDFDELNRKEDELKELNKKRAEAMNAQEYVYFTSCRSCTFLTEGREKFIDFLELERRGLKFFDKNKPFIEFLSYLLCKCIGHIIEKIVKERNDGILEEIKEPLKPEEIKSKTEAYLNMISMKIRKSIKDVMSLEEKACNFYQKKCMEESNVSMINEMDPRNRKLIKGEDKATKVKHNNINDNQPKEWKKLDSKLRYIWLQRFIAENQVKNFIKNSIDIVNWDDFNPINEYSEYLANKLKYETINEKNLNSTVLANLFDEIFEEYLQKNHYIKGGSSTNIVKETSKNESIKFSKVTQQPQQNKPKPNQKIERLQSLFKD